MAKKINATTSIKLFEQKQVRSAWNEGEEEKWYFSVVDVLFVLTESIDVAAYWRKLKQRLKAEGNETVTNLHGLKMNAADGKMRIIDVADTEQLFKLIQSIPSPKAEPFKLWIAKVAKERIDEIEDPEIGIDRLMETYLKKGYSKEWINQQLKIATPPPKEGDNPYFGKITHSYSSHIIFINRRNFAHL